MSEQRSTTIISQMKIIYLKHKTCRRNYEEIIGGSESTATIIHDYRNCSSKRHGTYLFEGSVFTKVRTNLVTGFQDPVCLITPTRILQGADQKTSRLIQLPSQHIIALICFYFMIRQYKIIKSTIYIDKLHNKEYSILFYPILFYCTLMKSILLCLILYGKFLLTTVVTVFRHYCPHSATLVNSPICTPIRSRLGPGTKASLFYTTIQSCGGTWVREAALCVMGFLTPPSNP